MNIDWFQLGPIPHDAISGYYNPWLVALSYCIAVLASYVTLDLVGQLHAEQSNRAKAYWLVGGAFTMGAPALFNAFFHRKRLHSGLDYSSPVYFEARMVD